MQETQFATRLAQEDRRWLMGDADLGNVLAPFYAGLAAPVGLDTAPPPEPQSQLSAALVTVSVDLNALTLEQVRLRETLETLNSTLFINGSSLETKTVDATSVPAKNQQKEPASSTSSWTDKGLEYGATAAKFVGKELLTSLWDTAKSRVSGKAVDAIAERFPNAGKWLKNDKSKGVCCPGSPVPGPASPSIYLAPDYRRTEEKKTSGKKPGKLRTWLRTASDRLGTGAGYPSRMGFQAVPTTQGAVSSAQRVSGNPGKPLGLIDALARGQFERPGGAGGPSPKPVPIAVSVPHPTPAPNTPHVPTSRLAAAMTRLESAGASRLGPLRYADAAYDVVQGLRTGDTKAIASGLGAAGGTWAGASAGASAGAAIGTMIFPGVGTAVGGVIGGLLGGEAGTWLGDKLFGSNDRLPAPNAVSKELNTARTDNVQVTIAPSIQITGINPADAQQVVNQVIQALQFQCMPMVTDTLGIRRNAALADPSGGD
ncbi:tail tape measure protein [Pseudomonas sp. S1_E04]